MSHELGSLRWRQNAENSGWNSPGAGVACRYGQIHRGVDTGPGHHGIDRIFPTITIGLTTIAGVDFIPLGDLPEVVPVATNGGGHAEPMAEHALAMTLAAAKRLIVEHENLKRGQFNQFARNRMLAGGVCGIFGFGGIGAATGRLMSSIGMRVHAINRRGRTDEQVDWIGTPGRLNKLLEVADVLLISAPLTRATYGLIGAAELGRMKDDAILVNLARGEIVQERPLYDHLVVLSQKISVDSC